MINSDASDVVVGHFDGIFGRVAAGWAYLPVDKSRTVEVEVYDGERLVGEGIANRLREDLVEADIGSGLHGFSCVLPLEIFDGAPHEIHVRPKGSTRPLSGGPHRLKKLLSLSDAFNSTDLSFAPPLSDFQNAVLKSLTSVSEALLQQSRAIAALLGHRDSQTIGNHQNPAPDENAVYQTEFARRPPAEWDIIVFSIIDWSFRIQRPQHLAANFAKMGCRVLYVNAHLHEHSGDTPRFKITGIPAPNVFEIVLKCSGTPPSLYGGFSSPEQIREICSSLEDALAYLQVNSPVAIVQYPTWLPIVQSIPGACIVFDCMDHLAGFSTASPEAARLETELVCTADAVITSSSYLHDHVAKYRPNATVRNAAEIEFFSTAPNATQRLEQATVGYYGAIAEWFDVELVEFAARSLPTWNFILIGSTAGANIESLRALPNVQLLGELSYSQLPKYLHGFDCCLIPFKLTELIKATNPVKVYEYLAAGKPVVATEIPELKLLPDGLVSVAKNKRQFVEAIKSSLTEAPKKKAERQLWALDHSWTSRAQDFLHYVKTAFPKVTVVVLTYNGVEFTKACLLSLERYSAYPNLELICVDNGSTDGTPAYLTEWARERRWAKIILNAANLGFAAGNNIGIRAATGDYVILLNNDTYVTPGWIRDLIRPLRVDPSVGMTGPVTNAIGNEQKIDIHYQSMEEMLSSSRHFTRSRKADFLESSNLAFFCVAIPKQVITEVGLLDEQYGMGYFEDDDYCMRVRERGYRLLITDGVFVHHHLSASFNQLPDKKLELMKKNKEIFEKRWGKWLPHRYREMVES